MEDRRMLNEFNQRFGPAVTEVERLRLPFIQTRFGYLKQYFESVVDERYSPGGLSRLLLGSGYDVALPGTSENPWEFFSGRPSYHTEEYYYRVLFQSKDPSVTSKELFVRDFNTYMKKQRVLVELKTDTVKMYWSVD